MMEKDVEEFQETPSPQNINQPTKLDPFMRVLLKKKGQNKVISIDDEMDKIHDKLYQILGPLVSALYEMQNRLSKESDEGMNVDPESILRHLNNAIVILGKTINKVAYEKNSILGLLNDAKGAKRQLKNHSEDIKKKKKFLFGEDFQKHLKTVTKAQESAEKTIFEKQKQHRAVWAIRSEKIQPQ